MRLLSSVLFGLCLPMAALAQDLPAAATAEIAPTVRECFAEYAPATGDTSCLGQASQACLAEAGETTLTTLACIGAETQAWDSLLNTEYKARRAEMDKTGLTDKLVAAQRAWVAFRDAECGLEVARWGDGTLAGVVGANCLMEMTAARAAQLRDKKAEP
jgi:uncharacterized protein YecT (DUF1311 family)